MKKVLAYIHPKIAGSNPILGKHFALLCRILIYITEISIKSISIKFLGPGKIFFLEFRPTFCVLYTEYITSLRFHEKGFRSIDRLIYIRVLLTLYISESIDRFNNLCDWQLLQNNSCYPYSITQCNSGQFHMKTFDKSSYFQRDYNKFNNLFEIATRRM